VGLGHTRLAIIDIEGGKQPMSSFDGRFTMVFNGEIYNYRELRNELEGDGYRFITSSDTEVLLNSYHRWGTESLKLLDGMFSFALFDEVERKLLLARDRTGIKPLYYYRDQESIVFASELKAILSWPHVQRRVDRFAVRDFLMMGHSIAPSTCFRDCRELEPGSYLEISTISEHTTRYWSWSRREKSRTEVDPLAVLDRELKAAVRGQMVADVPIGAFLSGGIDSSLIVSLAVADAGSRLSTFNVRFGELTYDESRYARAVAAHVGTDHHEIVVERNCASADLVHTVLNQFDQPFGDSSAIPTYLICREIRKHVKVVLGGDGGDEMFGGYERFAYADLAGWISSCPALTVRILTTMARHAMFLSQDSRRQAVRLLRVAQVPPNERSVALSAIVQQADLPIVLQPDFLPSASDMTGLPSVANSKGESGGADLVDFTVNHRLPGDYLKKIDIMSSAHGLEVRVPMLSNHILSFAESLPTKLKYSLVKNKILLRRLARQYLPREIARKPKQGFGIPLDTWLGTQGRKDVAALLSSRSARILDFVRRDFVEAVSNQFATGQWKRSHVSRYSVYQAAYALWSLESWLQRWNPSV